MSKIISLTAKETKAIRDLAKMQDLTIDEIIRQAIRHYQKTVLTMREGGPLEIRSVGQWSGDTTMTHPREIAETTIKTAYSYLADALSWTRISDTTTGLSSYQESLRNLPRAVDAAVKELKGSKPSWAKASAELEKKLEEAGIDPYKHVNEEEDVLPKKKDVEEEEDEEDVEKRLWENAPIWSKEDAKEVIEQVKSLAQPDLITLIREAIVEAKYAEASFAGVALRVNPNDPANDKVLERIAKVQSKLTECLRVADSVEHNLKSLIGAMVDDPEYAWGWHCNIAMSAFDAGARSHAACNRGAALFLKLLSDGKVDTTTHPAYKGIEEKEDSNDSNKEIVRLSAENERLVSQVISLREQLLAKEPLAMHEAYELSPDQPEEVKAPELDLLVDLPPGLKHAVKGLKERRSQQPDHKVECCDHNSLKEWEKWVAETATYLDCGNGDITYPLLGLVGELGELVNAIVKYYRKSDLITLKVNQLPEDLRRKLKDESYDALHFLAFLLQEQGISLEEIISYGRAKLEKRIEEGTVHKENRTSGSIVGREVTIHFDTGAREVIHGAVSDESLNFVKLRTLIPLHPLNLTKIELGDPMELPLSDMTYTTTIPREKFYSLLK